MTKKILEINNLYGKQLNFSNEIQDFLSNEITGNIRELLGAINRIISFQEFIKKHLIYLK